MPGLRLIWDERFRRYDFGPAHPFQLEYRALGAALLRADRAERGRDLAVVGDVPIAGRAELERFHRGEYIDRIERASGRERPGFLDTGDTPGFAGCHDAAARLVGGALAAVDLLLGETPPDRAFHPAGGLHHAAPAAASGFCIYNDVAVALARALDGPGKVPRAAYVDIDAHHGDGVMYGFYRDGRLLDIDFHQDGRTLFPGTGAVDECGRGDGEGWKINVPMPAGTGDAEFPGLFRRLVPGLLDAHRPELVVLQHGMDAHVGDPLASLRLGPPSYRTAVTELRQWCDAHRVPLLVTGGGGYRADSVAVGLARAGTLLDDPGGDPPDGDPLPPEWRRLFREATGRPAPTHWGEPPEEHEARTPPEWTSSVIAELSRVTGRRFP